MSGGAGTGGGGARGQGGCRADCSWSCRSCHNFLEVFLSNSKNL